jgi:L-lactate dehydrogenase
MNQKHYHFCDKFKVSVIGCGNVGATAAYAMLLGGTPNEMTLIDMNKDRAEGLLLDFQHSLSFLPYVNVTAGTDLKLTAESDVIVITAGARQKEGQTRLELIEANRQIFKKMIPELVRYSRDAILLIVTNPVDILTHEALKLSKLPPNRVFGTGTMLDTSRLQYHLSEKLKVSPRDIQAFIMGEHGDTSFPVWSSANICGKPVFDFPRFDQKAADKCYSDTRNAAYRIIHDMGFTCYSIAIVVREIVRAIYENSRIVVPLSTELRGEYGLRDVALSIPCVLGSTGIVDKIEIPLSAKEKTLLKKSADTLKRLYQK